MRLGDGVKLIQQIGEDRLRLGIGNPIEIRASEMTLKGGNDDERALVIEARRFDPVTIPREVALQALYLIILVANAKCVR